MMPSYDLIKMPISRPISARDSMSSAFQFRGIPKSLGFSKFPTLSPPIGIGISVVQSSWHVVYGCASARPARRSNARDRTGHIKINNASDAGGNKHGCPLCGCHMVPILKSITHGTNFKSARHKRGCEISFPGTGHNGPNGRPFVTCLIFLYAHNPNEINYPCRRKG